MPFEYGETGIVTEEVNGIILPVWIDEDGTKSPIDADSLMSTMRKQRQNENAAKKELEKISKLTSEYQKLFEGVDDPNAWVNEAREAMEAVQNFDEGQKKSKEELEKLMHDKMANADLAWQSKFENMRSELENQNKAVRDQLSTKERQVKSMLINGVFDRSQFIKERTTLTPDIACTAFSKFFDIIEVPGPNGNTELEIRAYNPKEGLGENRKELFSKVRPGEYATPDEAIEIIVGMHPQADIFLKATGKQGSGSETTEKQSGGRGLQHKDFYASMNK